VRMSFVPRFTFTLVRKRRPSETLHGHRVGRYHLYREHSLQLVLRRNAVKGSGGAVIEFKFLADDCRGDDGLAQQFALKLLMFGSRYLKLRSSAMVANAESSASSFLFIAESYSQRFCNRT